MLFMFMVVRLVEMVNEAFVDLVNEMGHDEAMAHMAARDFGDVQFDSGLEMRKLLRKQSWTFKVNPYGMADGTMQHVSLTIW